MNCYNLYAVKVLDDLVSLFSGLEAAANVVDNFHAWLNKDMARAVARQAAIALGQMPVKRFMEIHSMPIGEGTRACYLRSARKKSSCGDNRMEALQVGTMKAHELILSSRLQTVGRALVKLEPITWVGHIANSLI